MKKHVWITILIVMTLIIGSIWTVQAEIIPPYGEGQIGLSAVVLCENLTVRQLGMCIVYMYAAQAVFLFQVEVSVYSYLAVIVFSQ